MAKSQNRSGREPKKPKTSKKKHGTPAYLMAESGPVQKIVPDASASKH
ncbi:hypothetical protein [Telmatospirillum sp.]|nr:hypothetical protein [Telmatospirillum sp.]MDR3435767.1 hypothetical protein [Telmatospirillum sp.]